MSCMLRANNIAADVFTEEVDVIGCHHIVNYAQAEALLSFEEPVQITATVPRKL